MNKNYGKNSKHEIHLAEKLIEMHPWSEMVRFAKTGGEANSIAVRIAVSPPAMIPMTISLSIPNVGGHSEASSIPNRPLVPEPI